MIIVVTVHLVMVSNESRSVSDTDDGGVQVAADQLVHRLLGRQIQCTGGLVQHYWKANNII